MPKSANAGGKGKNKKGKGKSGLLQSRVPAKNGAAQRSSGGVAKKRQSRGAGAATDAGFASNEALFAALDDVAVGLPAAQANAVSRSIKGPARKAANFGHLLTSQAPLQDVVLAQADPFAALTEHISNTVEEQKSAARKGQAKAESMRRKAERDSKARKAKGVH